MDSIKFVPHSSVCACWHSLEPDIALAALGVLPARGLDPKPRHPAKPLEPWAPSVVSRPHRRLARQASSNYCGEASSDDCRKSDPIPNEPPFLEGPLDDCGPRVASPPRATAHAGVLRLAATQRCCQGDLSSQPFWNITHKGVSRGLVHHTVCCTVLGHSEPSRSNDPDSR